MHFKKLVLLFSIVLLSAGLTESSLAMQQDQSLTRRTERTKALFNAIRMNDKDKIYDLACKDANDSELWANHAFQNLDPLVNVRNSKGKTPLHEAAGLDHLEAVEVLLELNANLNSVWKGFTPMSWAHYKKAGQVVRYLYKHGGRMGPRAHTPATTDSHYDADDEFSIRDWTD